MPSPFSQGAQNADTAFSTFVDGDVTFFNSSLTTAQTIATVAHGLSAAPDFVLVTHDSGDDIASTIATAGLIGWSATATTLTLTCDNTAGSAVLSVFAANLS
jgi:hypothetical protein